MTSSGTVRVGAQVVARDDAERWLRTYVSDGNRVAAQPYAFPAYDRFDSGSGDSELNDGDLMAPGLLNVNVTIERFYSLQGVRKKLEDGLGQISTDLVLMDAAPPEVERLNAALYSLLDQTPRPAGVRATLLSKVLHRKRPGFLMLHDKWVRQCYVGEDRPVDGAPSGRSWASYMTSLSLAVREDLRAQTDVWSELHQLTDGMVTPLRLLDIVAWHAGRRA